MQKAIKQKNKKTLNGNEPNLQKNMSSGKLFEVMFVHNNEEQSVEVEESPFIDFSRVIEHLDEGNSIFIAPKYIKKPSNRNDDKSLKRFFINYV